MRGHVLMRTLLGLFLTREQGMAALERLRSAGLSARTIDTPADAATVSRDAVAHDAQSGHGTAGGAALGALSGGLVGAIPGAIVGALLGHGLSDMNAHRYEKVVAEGGIALVVEAGDLQAGATAEDILHTCGAVHVHTGEVPTT
jgi:uncharacterized membrane protein